MIISLLAGIILGVIIAIAPGPVAVTAMKTGLNKGTKEGGLVGLGTAFVDFSFCLGAIFATSAALSVVDNFSLSYPIITLSIQLLVVLGIVIYGITHLKSSKPVVTDNVEPLERKNKILVFLSSKGPFFVGLAVALANIANPSFMTSLAYFTMQVQKFGLIENTPIGKFAFSLGFGIGNFLWIYALVRTLVHFKSRMSDQMMLRIQKFAGVTLIGFGTILGYRIFELTKWSEILRILIAF